jgi:glycosyltransferase involved in cell wall biosynthesis
MILQIAAPSRSLGPRRAAWHLAEVLRADGITTRLVERPDRDGPLNAHLSNSSRSLLVPLARRRGCLVTLHDVVPRDSRVHRVLSPVVVRILRRHHVVVHSHHAAELLRRNGVDQPVGVVPLQLPVQPPTNDARLAERTRLLHGRSGNLLVFAGLLRARKGVDQIIEAAARLPDSSFVLLGKVADSATADALEHLPPNIGLVEDPDDATFSLVLAAADALLLPRRSSVGETSGPLVMAHALGTPAALLDVGSAPEYAVTHDLVLPADTPLPQFLTEASVRSWDRVRLPADDQRAGLVAAYRREFKSLGWT